MIVLLGVLAALAVVAASYQLFVMRAALAFRRRGPDEGADLGLVSVLKPAGAPDRRLEKNLRAHLTQTYAEWEVVCVSPERPAVEGVRWAPAPELDAGEPVNRKVILLETALAEARGDVIVLADADVRVSPDWLARTTGPLADPNVGMTTCLYRSVPARTLASRLDALWIATDFAGQVLAAERIEGVRFGLGAAIALRRSDLEAIGSFATLRPYLADDYQLGVRTAARGLRVHLSREVVETGSGEEGAREVWTRRVRWSRTVRASRPGGHVSLIATQATVWAAALAGLSGFGTPWSYVAAGALAARLASGWSIAAALEDRAAIRDLWLVPLADLATAAVWITSFFSRRVEWRGRILELDAEGRIVRACAAGDR